MSDMSHLKSYIREVPDFPTPGVSFKDISPLLLNPACFRKAIGEMEKYWLNRLHVSKIVAIDARGFIFGSALAYATQKMLVLARKKGKLPGPIVSLEYSLEYSKAVLELQSGTIAPGEHVAIVDDVLATGGTAAAVAALVERCGGYVEGFCFLVELPFLHGRNRIGVGDIYSLISFDK